MSSYDYERNMTAASHEAEQAFKHEVFPRMIKPVMEKARADVLRAIIDIRRGRFSDQRLEYAIMRHRPLSMMPEDFLEDLLSVFADWSDKVFSDRV